MVSTNPSYDVDLFNSAYDNICLNADYVWAHNREDSYRKLNQSLWIENSKLREYSKKEKSKKFVRDVIPESRLAKYGNYTYNVSRESLYKDNSNKNTITYSNFNDEKTSEPWMHKDVEEYFTRLTFSYNDFANSLKNSSLFKNVESPINCEGEYKKYRKLPYVILDAGELQLQSRICQDSIRGLWCMRKFVQPSPSSETRIVNCFRCKKSHHVPQTIQKKGSRCRYEEVCNIHHTVIISKNRYKGRDTRGNSRAALPILSPEVPEFFPKGPHIERHYESVPLQYFPSSNENFLRRVPFPNVTAMFQNPGIPLLTTPIMNPMIRSPHWIPRLAPPLQIQVPICTMGPQQTFTSIQSICPIIHRPIQLHEKVIQANQINPIQPTPIPVYQRPTELYQDHRRKACGVDFNNLILLTKNAMKIRRSRSKTQNYETEVFRGISKQFMTVDKLVSDLRSFEKKFECDSNSSDHDKDDETTPDSKR